MRIRQLQQYNSKLSIQILENMKNKAQDIIVCNNFKLVKKLGTGAFGEIYLAENRSNPNEKYAAKLQQVTTKFPQLHFEAKMYKYLASGVGVTGIPKIHAITVEGQYNVMLMDLLGLSIEDIFVNNNKVMSLKSALMVGYQMLQRIKFLHQRQIIHRDIKPDNFLMGSGKNAHLLYIVDFGLSKKYIKDNKHIPFKQGKDLTGTARYASINTHMGIQQSRRDDIESIGYVIMYLLRGVLPWQNMNAKDTKTKYKLIMEKKKSTPAEVLCKGFPQQLASFINYARQLKFEEDPDYGYLFGLLKTAMKNKNIEMDYMYDWTKKQVQLQKQQKKIQKQQQKIKIYQPRQGSKAKQTTKQKQEALKLKIAQKQKQKQPVKPKPPTPLAQNRQTQLSRNNGTINGNIVNKNIELNKGQGKQIGSKGTSTSMTIQKCIGPKISTIKR